MSRLILPRRLRDGPVLRRPQRGFVINPFAFSPAGATDPFFANVVALLHLDGANGSTTFTDHSPLGLTWVRDGVPVISTAQSVFGGASLGGTGTGSTLNGTNQNIRSPINAALALNTAAWTIEGWLRSTNVGAGAYRGVITLDTAADTGLFVVGNKLTWYEGANYQHQSTIATNTWYHVAVTSDAIGDIRIFQAGVLGTTVFTSGVVSRPETRYFVGASSQGVEFFAGHIDDVRVTKGVCRYTTTFTPPAAPFPNS